MLAKFGGTCKCGAKFGAGAEVTYDFASKKMTACPACRKPRANGSAPVAETLRCIFEVTKVVWRGPGYDGTERHIVKAELPSDAEQVDRAKLPISNYQTFSVKGALGDPQPGDVLEVMGSFKQGQYGWELQASCPAVSVVGVSMSDIATYLKRFPQVGPKRASQIVALYPTREAILDVIQNRPEELAEKVAGITQARAESIRDAFVRDVEMRDVAIWLFGKGLPPAITSKALTRWERFARNELVTDPYKLMELRGVGFRTADELARTKFGVAVDDPRRCAAAVLHILECEAQEGHIWTDLDDLLGGASSSIVIGQGGGALDEESPW